MSSSLRPRTRRLALAALIAFAAPAIPSSAHAYPVHQVTPGETLSSIAGANGLSLARLAAANGMAWNGQVVVGQSLQIPPQDGAYTGPQGETLGYATSSTPVGSQTSTAASPSSSSASPGSSSGAGSSSGSSTGGGGHAVSGGDTLSAIAARLGTTVAALAAANGIANPNLIYAGSSLKAPAPGTTATPAPSTVPASTTTTAVTKTASTTSFSTGPEGSAAYAGGGAGNSAERVSSSQVSSIAAQHGVSGNLAAAIAWQESGNNNALTSSTGARGVMQIMPGTWQWINSQLAGGSLRTHTAADNVKAGSLLLKALLRETGGNEEQAIAGYYQGLNSVRSRGMYEDTKQYVRNVQALRGRVGQ